MKKISLLFFLFISQITFTQEGSITGKVIDKSTNRPVEYATIKLLKQADSTVLTGMYSLPDGRFELDKVPFGSYLLRIIYAENGIDTLISNIKVNSKNSFVNLGAIALQNTQAINKTLDEVKVVGKQDLLKNGIDKKIYNVGEDLSSRGGTANDVLSKLPSVDLDQDGNVTLRGEGKVTLLIDGRPSSLTTGGTGKTLLDALPAGSIERIEIVNNPSAKYDPDGTSGIINIVLKKNKLKGVNGIITTTAATGFIPNGKVGDGNASLSYRNSFVNTYASYAARYLEGYRNNYSDIYKFSGANLINLLDQNRVGTDQNFGHTFRAGIDLNLPRRQLIGFSATGALGERNRTGSQWNRLINSTGSTDSLWKRGSLDPSQQKNLDLNANYKYDFKNDRGGITADFTQSFGEEKTQGFYYQEQYNNDSSVVLRKPLEQRLNNVERNDVFTGQSDLIYTFPKINGRIETGIKAIIRNQHVSTFSETKDTTNNLYEADTLANFQYQYDESIYSWYSSFGQQFNKFNYQVGLRLEQAYQIPNLISESNRIENTYFNWFPSVHIKYLITEKQEFSLSYSKRITRATAADLNPFTNFSDPFNLRTGNPYLNPEYIDSYDLGYALKSDKSSLTTSLYYRNSNGMIMRIREFGNNYAKTTFTNIDRAQTVGAEVVWVYKPIKQFRNTFSSNISYIKYTDDHVNANWNVGGFVYGAKYAGAFEFWNRTATLQLNVNYNGPRVSVQGLFQRRGPVDISGEKSFKNGKCTVGFKVTDIFNRQGFIGVLDQPLVDQNFEYKWETRRIYLTFSYKFGKLEISNKKPMPSQEGGDM